MNAAKRLCVKNWSPTRCASTISMLSGPTDVPLLRVSMGEHFKSIKAEFGDSPALISYHQQKRLTYYELDDLSDKMMAGLAAVGVKKGDRVGACFNNTWEFGVTSIGIEKLGAILVSINPALPDNQFKSLLSFATCSTLIISSFLHLPYRPPRSSLPFLKSLANDLQANQLECPEVPSLSRIILVGDKPNERGHRGITDFADLLQYEPIPLPALHPDDVINIQFTSGTTGVAKGAALTHCNILNNGVHIGRRMGLRGGSDKVCIPVPVFHCFGLVLGNGAAWGTGSTVVYPAAAFDAKQTLRCVRDEKCTALHAVPTMFVGMFEEEKEINRGGFESLRTGIAAGSSIPASLMSKIHRKLNLIEQVICYGMTETSPVSAMTQPDDPLVKRLETVGTVMPHVQIKIVDTNDAILPIDKHGEICVAGYLLQKGYWDNPEKTREVMKHDKDGKLWMYTGDEGALDRDGYLRVTGRIKDLIIRYGISKAFPNTPEVVKIFIR